MNSKLTEVECAVIGSIPHYWRDIRALEDHAFLHLGKV
jgi:hypothetical protein